MPLKPVYAKNLPIVKGTENVPDGEKVIATMRKQHDSCALSFSCGKDSIGAWLALHGKFKCIIPIYMYLVPNLSFVDRALDYYEDFFGTKIYRVPHPSLYRLLRNYVFQTPDRITMIDNYNFPLPSYEDMVSMVLEDLELDMVYCATGVRATDSPIRYMAVKKYGPINHTKRTFWPIWDWRKKYLIERMKDARIKLPADYKMFGRSFDGLDHRFLVQIKEHYPKDYKQILTWFPLADLEMFRRKLSAA